jgi:prepilin-type N-terminal cleavage/methylation domain-containing protein
MSKLTRQKRNGFTMVEMTVTLALVAVLSVVVAQCVVWSMRERVRLAAHQAALELAANTLESARAQPLDKLDKAWAESHTVPSDMEAILPDGKMLVTVETMQDLPQSRRVTVEIRWQLEPNLPGRSVQLTGVFSPREAKSNGGKP